MVHQTSGLVKQGSQKGNGETNDCVVLAIANATGVSYDIAHSYCERYLMRQRRRGVMTNAMTHAWGLGEFKLGNTISNFQEMPVDDITNTYKLYGEYIKRKKTVKSFIQSHPKGTYVVLVAGHAFTVKDGTLIDHKGLEFKPTRKVQVAFKVTTKEVVGSGTQLKLF